MIEIKIKTRKATKPRHPEMVSHGDALDIPTKYSPVKSISDPNLPPDQFFKR
jgi:hypothetical protein